MTIIIITYKLRDSNACTATFNSRILLINNGESAGSLHFGASFLGRTIETLSSTLTFSSPFSFHLLVHNSLRHLV